MKKKLNRIEAKLDEILRVETQLLKNTANVNGSKGLMQTIQAWSDSSKNGVCLSERGELVYNGTQSIKPAQDIIINNLPSELDWSKAPDGFDWFCIGEYGHAWFFTHEPFIVNEKWTTVSDKNKIQFVGIFDSKNWRNSSCHRPVTITAQLNTDIDGYLAGKKSFISAYVDLLLARMAKEGRFSTSIAVEKSQSIQVNDIVIFEENSEWVFAIVDIVNNDYLGLFFSTQKTNGKWTTQNWFDVGLEDFVIRRITQAEAVEFRKAMEAVYG